MYSQIILLLFGLHTISAQLRNIPPPPEIPRLDVASLPSHLQKLLAHINDAQSTPEVQKPKTVSRDHTYGMNLRNGHGEVWNDVSSNYTNNVAPSELKNSNNKEDPSRDSNIYHQTPKTDETTTPQTSTSRENDAIANYKDSSNYDQQLPSIAPPQTLPLGKPESGDQRGSSTPNKIIPSVTPVESYNVPVPTKLEDQKFKITPSPKTYGMNLAGGHGRVWNNIGGSHLDVDDATPSKSIQPESKDKTTAAAISNQTSSTIVKPVTYTPKTSSEKTPAINMPSITPPQTLPLGKLESGDQKGSSNPNKIIPSVTPVESYNVPVPTKLEDQKFMITPSPKTYGMNLAGGHGLVWNNIEGSHLDVNDATPSKSIQPESKDKTTAAATSNQTPSTIVKSVTYTLKTSSEKTPTIHKENSNNHNQNPVSVTNINPVTTVKSQKPVTTNVTDQKDENVINKAPSPKTDEMNLSGGHGHVANDDKNYTPSKSIQPEDKTILANTNGKKFISTTTLKPIVYTINPKASSEKSANVNYKDNINSQNQNLPSVTITNPVSTENSRKPVPPQEADQKVKTPSSKTYGMNLSGGHGYVWNNIGGLQEHFDDNKATPSKSIEPEDKTNAPAPTNAVVNIKDSIKVHQEPSPVTTVKPVTYPYYTTSKTLTENAPRISNSYRNYNQNIPYVTTPQTLTEKPPTHVQNQQSHMNQNQAMLSKPHLKKPNTPNKDILKRASPRTYGMKLEGDHGYVWNDLDEPGMHYYLNDETNNGINPTTAKDENSSKVPVTEKPTEGTHTADVDPTTEKNNETLPVSTAQPTTESYRISSTERNKNNDSSSNGSSDFEPEDEIMKYIEKLVKDEVAKLLESIKEKKPDEVPVTTEKSNDNSNETNNTTKDQNTSNVSTSTEKVKETTVSVTTERWTEPTSTEASSEPSTTTPNINTTTESNNTGKNTTSDTVTPDSDEELKKYIEKLIREEVAKRLENATKTDNSNDKEIKQHDKKNENKTLDANDNRLTNVTNFYGSLIGEGNVTNIFIFYPNDKNLESILNDAKNMTKPEKNKSNETDADSNNNRTTESPTKITTESSTTTSTERPATESTNTSDVTTSSEKDNDTISVTTESTTSETKTDSSSTESYETTTKGSPNTTTEKNNKKDDEITPELKEEIKKYIDELVKDEVAKQLDEEKKDGIEKEKEPDVIPVTTEESNNYTADTTSTESPATEKNTETPDSTNTTTSNEQNHETTVTTAKSNKETNETMSTESPTTEEASTQSSENTTTETNINSATTTEATTKTEDGTPSEPKIPDSPEELKKLVEKLVKDEVAKLLDAEKNNGSKNENKADVIPVTTEKSVNDTTDTTTTESPATEKNTEAPDSNNTTTSSEKDNDTTPVTTEKANNDTTDTTTTESPATEKNTEAPGSTNATTSSEKDNETTPVTTEKTNNDTTDTTTTESTATEKNTEAPDSNNTTTSSEKDNETTTVITTEKTNNDTNDTTTTESTATEKNSEVPDSTNATTSSEQNNETTPVTTEKTNNDSTDTTTTESPTTEKNTEVPDNNNTTTSSEKDNDTTPLTTEKTNDDTTDKMSTESPANEKNTEAPDNNNTSTSSEKENDTTPVTSEGSTESTSTENNEQASTESSNANSTTEANKENDDTSNKPPKSKEEIKKYVEQLVKEEVAKLLATEKDDASKN